MRNVYNLNDLSKIVNRHTGTLRRWAREGSLPTVEVGKGVYVVERPVFLESLSGGTLAEYFTVAEAAKISAALTPKAEGAQ